MPKSGDDSQDPRRFDPENQGGENPSTSFPKRGGDDWKNEWGPRAVFNEDYVKGNGYPPRDIPKDGQWVLGLNKESDGEFGKIGAYGPGKTNTGEKENGLYEPGYEDGRGNYGDDGTSCISWRRNGPQGQRLSATHQLRNFLDMEFARFSAIENRRWPPYSGCPLPCRGQPSWSPCDEMWHQKAQDARRANYAQTKCMYDSYQLGAQQQYQRSYSLGSLGCQKPRNPYNSCGQFACPPKPVNYGGYGMDRMFSMGGMMNSDGIRGWQGAQHPSELYGGF